MPQFRFAQAKSSRSKREYYDSSYLDDGYEIDFDLISSKTWLVNEVKDDYLVFSSLTSIKNTDLVLVLAVKSKGIGPNSNLSIGRLVKGEGLSEMIESSTVSSGVTIDAENTNIRTGHFTLLLG